LFQEPAPCFASSAYLDFILSKVFLLSGDLAGGTGRITSFRMSSLCSVECLCGPACDGDCDVAGVDRSVRISDSGLTPDDVSRVAGTDDDRRSFDPPTPRGPLLLLWPQAKSSICQKFMFLRVWEADEVVTVEAGAGCRLGWPRPRLTLGDELRGQGHPSIWVSVHFFGSLVKEGDRESREHRYPR
jgi:hypothetical protein